MNVIIEPKAAGYLKNKNAAAVTVDLIGCASWGVGEPQPAVQPGEPKDNKGNFNLLKADGFDVYVKNNISASDDTLYIKHKKVLFTEKLVVEGIVF